MKRSNTLDALDLFEDETEKLRELCRLWVTTEPARGTSDEVVTMQFEHGTVGKLLLRHAAIYLAATENIHSAIATAGPSALASDLAQRAESIRPMLAALDGLSREVNSVWVLTPAFVAAVERLSGYLHESGSLDTENTRAAVDAVSVALGQRRNELRSAKFIVKHAPTRPGRPRWYNEFGPVQRMHTIYDKVRGFPSENSTNWSDARLAHKFAPRTER